MDTVLSQIEAPSSTSPADLISFQDFEQRDIFAPQKRKSWEKFIEARCDFAPKLALKMHGGFPVVSIWQKSVYGQTLTEIKADENEVEHFATSLAPVILSILGESLALGDWAVVTTPKRRHRTRNFATLIGMRLADLLGVPFREDVALCHSKERVNAIFELNYLPDEHNLIVFDDFVTTGSTLKSMRKLLLAHNRNCIFFVGINNHF